MAITQAFQQAVQNGDVLSVRIMMKDSLLRDPSFAEFKEMESQAQNTPGLYDAHDGTVFCIDKSAWNDDYMCDVRVDLIDNFSHERIAHLKEVIQYLHPYTQEEIKNLAKTDSNIQKRELITDSGICMLLGVGIAHFAGVPIATGIILGGAVGATMAVIKNEHQKGRK